MKKIFVMILVFLLALPNMSFSAFFQPTFGLIIIENTTAGDGAFNFNIYRKNGQFFNLIPDAQSSVTSISGQGSTSLNLIADEYLLSELPQQQWQLKNLSCNSSDIRTNFIYSNGTVSMSDIFDGAQVTCIFTNAPAVSYKTPILILPGMLGTEIYKDDSLLWADVPKMVNPLNTDSFMDPLQFQTNLEPSDGGLRLGSVNR